MSNEIVCQSQGRKTHAGTNTMEFILHYDNPRERKVTYVWAVWDIRSQKPYTHQTRLRVGGNPVEYSEEVITPTEDLTAVKLNVNGIISDIISRYMCMGVNDFYIKNRMDQAE